MTKLSDCTEENGNNLTEALLKTKQVKQEEKKVPTNLVDLFRHPESRKACLISGLFYFCTQYIQYVSVFGVQALKGNIYFNSFIGAMADLIGCSLISTTLRCFKRKTAYTLTFLMALITSCGFLIVKVP